MRWRAPPRHSQGMPYDRAAIKVFIADDSRLIRDRVTGMLQASAMTVIGGAATPQACIDAILALRPDVVVLDIQLQGGSGLQVLRAIRQAAPGTGVVVFSHNASAAYRQRYLREGANHFLDKNSEFEQLVQAVEAAARQALH
jgi:DNA-binding NarL/FixJ family response regulator